MVGWGCAGLLKTDFFYRRNKVQSSGVKFLQITWVHNLGTENMIHFNNSYIMGGRIVLIHITPNHYFLEISGRLRPLIFLSSKFIQISNNIPNNFIQFFQKFRTDVAGVDILK